ncbi:TonB family protein [Oculatella sp. FACHB-28]|uniref:energy transducer TonB n=1 Tax=Cyanophyceae TaxID=3028117 RepID=UPI0016873E62|nr:MULTISPECIES: energy transducer TonB [Cyanophyceae]MBD1998114.1 TonB family protein [Leptolyngbya sp. FACHB-541]MBD2057316.1 TonB family protein [Oculatella sp. FACHB-28]
MSLAQKYRDRFAAQRGSLTIYLAVAAAFHGGMVAGGILPWQPIEPPDLAVEAIEPIEFVYLETETETEQNSDRRSNIDAIAGGEAKPNLPIAAGKPGIEESLKENSTTDNKSIAPLLPPPVSPGRIVPASSPANSGQGKATETETEVKPDSPQSTSELSDTPNPEAAEAPDIAPANSNDSAFARLPQLEADSFSPNSTAPDPGFNPLEQTASSESDLPNQPDSSQTSDLPTSNSPASDLPTSPDQIADQTAAPFEAALNLGQEFAQIANSNRTASNEFGIDAEQDPIWGDYLAEMNQQIEQQWQRIQVDVDATRSVKVRFTVDQSGELTEWEVTQPSGLAIADEAAIQAIQQSAPFEPLPPAANQQPLTRTLTFYYSIRQPESVQ